jgi:hypothetical protein
MNTTYVSETIARQRMDENARQARTAPERHQIKTRAGRHFPTFTFPRRTGVVGPHAA